MPSVVIISPYYNRATVVDRTVLGIINQTYSDYKAYFIDDGSKDDTFLELNKYSSEKILAIKQKNIGFTNTLIATIEKTDSEYIAIQGSGDCSFPNRLAHQVQYLNDNPDVVMVGCHRVTVFESTGEELAVRPTVESDVRKQLFYCNPFTQGEVLIRRSAYVKCGGYRSFFTYRQDLDLWLRISDYGRLAIIPEILYRNYKLRKSVSGDVRQLFAAMACRDFAVYCARERLAGCPDPLDQKGPVAALMRPRSKTLAFDLSHAAGRQALNGNRQEAEFLLAAAFNERPILLAWLMRLMVWLPGLKHLRKLINGGLFDCRL